MEQSGVDERRNLDAFVSGLLAKKGLDDNPEAHANLLKKVNKKINTTVMAMLPISSLDYLEFCLSQKTLSDKQIRKVIDDAEIDTDEVIDVTLKRFGEDYLKGGEK